MQLEERIHAFLELGKQLRTFGNTETTPPELLNLEEATYRAERLNPWFTVAHCQKAIASLGDMLQPQAVEQWVARYPKLQQEYAPKVVGVIMAGNIPFVGFHDMLCILLSGNSMKAKLSSKDEALPRAIIALLTTIEPRFADRIVFEKELMKNFDAIIATGSDNSSRYFEYYFKKYPHIIRGNRNSVAILTGTETHEELCLLANDIFMYFGLGCRNVSKIYLPKGFDLNRLFNATAAFEYFTQHTKYMNNFDYQQAILLMNLIEIHSNGYSIFKEGTSLKSAISVNHLQFYTDLKTVHAEIAEEIDNIQCLVGKKESHPSALPLGSSQTPALWDYADNIDTLEFLLTLN